MINNLTLQEVNTHSKKEDSFLHYSLLVYIILFYSQIAVRYPIFEALRLELIVAVVLLISIFTKTQEVSDIFSSKVTFAGLLFFFSCVISIPGSLWISHSVEALIRLFKMLSIFFFIIAGIKTENGLRRFHWVYIGMVALIAVEPYINSQKGIGFETGEGGIQRLTGVTGLFSQPNSLGGFISANIPYMYYMIVYEKSILKKCLVIVLMIISIKVILMTESRTAFLGIIFFGLYLIILSKRKVFVVFLVCCSFALVWNITPDYTKERFLTMKSANKSITIGTKDEATTSMEARVQIMKDGWGIFLTRPITGVGLDAFVVARSRLYQRYWVAHNTQIQLLADLGIIGFVTFICFVFRIWQSNKQILKAIKDKISATSHIYNISLANHVFLILRLIESIFGGDAYENYWWLSAGLSVSIANIIKSKEIKEDK